MSIKSVTLTNVLSQIVHNNFEAVGRGEETQNKVSKKKQMWRFEFKDQHDL